ncbi:MAG: hypothetical protein PHX40_01930 [Bacilli bacterium]|nr:hypothetical protein [Bacilli bacterium]
MNTTSISSVDLSSFVDKSKVKKNDYFIADKDGKILYGKVINSFNGKSIILNDSSTYSTINFKDLDDIIFYTDRDIKSPYALSIIRMNG